MLNRAITYKQRLSMGFGSIALLLFGSVSLLKAGSIDYYTVMGTLVKVVPASLIIGALGWVMGSLLDKRVMRPRGVSLSNLVLSNTGVLADSLDKPDDDIDNIESLSPKLEIE